MGRMRKISITAGGIGKSNYEAVCKPVVQWLRTGILAPLKIAYKRKLGTKRTKSTYNGLYLLTGGRITKFKKNNMPVNCRFYIHRIISFV